MRYTTTYSKNLEAWVVKEGRAKKDGSFRYTGEKFSTEAEAASHMAYRNSIVLMDQVRALQGELSMGDLKEIGHQANNYVDGCTAIMETTDPDFSEMDPRGWLA